jgi:hypothetical protein
MDIKLVSENEIDNALDLILRVFMEFENCGGAFS